MVALALLAQKVLIAILDPNFGGDAGIRLNSAARPILRLGNRVWLPYLQLHIWALYLLRVPYWAYNLVPCFYLFAALVSLGVLGIRRLGCTWAGLALTLAVMFCFAEQRLVSDLATRLYQETLGVAFFYWLLQAGALDLRKSRVVLLVGALALVTRDTFQIYLLVLTLLNWKAIVADRVYRRSFFFLWSIPVLWLFSIPFGYLVHDGRLPKSLVEWPLMINKDEAAVSHLWDSLASLWRAVWDSNAAVLFISVLLAWGIIHWNAPSRGQSLRNPSGEFARRFIPFSLLSLGLVYAAIALFNPSRATFGNARMAYPLVEHLYVWALLALAATFSCRGITRYATRVLVMIGLLGSLGPHAGAWVPRESPQAKNIYPDLERLLRESSPNATPVVCFGPENIFDTYTNFVAPALYAKRRYLDAVNEIPKDCSVWISRPQAVPRETGNFEKVREYQVSGVYYVFRRRYFVLP